MKAIYASIYAIVLGSALASSASAQSSAPKQLHGSDTLFGVVTQAITNLGLQNDLQYVGGGSGTGESALLAGTQGVTAMSRAFAATARDTLKGQGVTLVEHVLGLDGVSVFVKRSEKLAQIDIPTLRAIFSCEITDWAKVPGSGKTGPIAVYRRNDVSGTTDTFKTLVGVTAFGACTKVLETTADIATVTSTNANAIGYSGLSGERADNKPLSIAKTADGSYVAPTVATVRAFTYPLARRLYVYAVSGARSPSEKEDVLFEQLEDRSFLDSILQNNEFVTCLPQAQGGCP